MRVTRLLAWAFVLILLVMLGGSAGAQVSRFSNSADCVAGVSYDPACDGNRHGYTGIIDHERVATHLLQGGAWWSLLGNSGTTAGTDFLGTTDSQDLVLKTNGAEAMRIDTSGNMGIGTASPGSYDPAADDLVVSRSVNSGMTIASGNDRWGSIYFADGTSGADAFAGFIQYRHGAVGEALRFGANGAEVMRLVGGNVGIGTTSPGSYDPAAGDLVISRSVNSGMTIASGNDRWGSIYFADGTSGADAFAGFIQYRHGAVGEALRFGANGAEVMRLVDGNVGIGTADPQEELDVAGTTRTNVLEITGGGDLAEPFEIVGAENVEPGMVVAIDPEHPGQLRIADEAYDHTVAGCVSGANGVNPGLTMQQEGTVAEGSFPVALSGRVYCWTDASYGAIQPGDLLTTSDTPGHVMKVTDYSKAQGAIIGKAMSSLTEGQGLVLVLAALQ